MQNQRNCHENVWILSGTADGPIIASKLLSLNYVVFVSVVTYKATKVYQKNDKLHIFTGKLNDEKEIKKFIMDNKINQVIDATHPFAVKISKYLKKVCLEINKRIYRFERVFRYKSKSTIIPNFTYLNKLQVKNKNILLAIGSRDLNKVAKFYINLGANVFARVIPTPDSISRSFSSCIKDSNIAILNPSNDSQNSLEYYLCNYWKIDFIICRDSGGYSQMLWDQICLRKEISLFLLKRPDSIFNQYVFSDFDKLIEKIYHTRS
tara:strand:- start:1083 stop:1874 length:792 start_codon:yes stop_codon:yes gene_type:complete